LNGGTLGGRAGARRNQFALMKELHPSSTKLNRPLVSPPKTRAFAIVALLFTAAGMTSAQTDEIQVYDAEIAEPGIFNLTWHNNFTPDGLRTPAFPGGLVNNHNLNGVTEWAYGVTEWFEAGLYLPLYSLSAARGPSINGGKIRFLFVAPHAAERKFFYGANFEFSYNAKHWDPRSYTSEIRPILGWHLKPWDLVINPILDNSWYGGFKALNFAPATRLAYNLNPKWAVAVEEYAVYGQLRNILPAREQFHQLWGVFDHAAKYVHIEAGVGFGLTPASDKVTLKLMLSRDLNSKREPQGPNPKPRQ
jgi:hypothetical protein